MVATHRLQYAAKIGRDLVLKVRDRCLSAGTPGCWKYMSQVTMLGLSFGAHVASQVSKELYQRTGQKVGKLIGETLNWLLFGSFMEVNRINY